MALKERVVSGFFWTAGEKFSSLLVQLCVSLMLLRLLDPTEFGLFAMLAFFSNLANSTVDSGFSQALIQKKRVASRDYSSIFWLNLAIAFLLYLLLVALASPISAFYDSPGLVELAPWVFLIIPLSALGLIQTTVLTKKMDFRTLSKANLTASVLSGIAVLAAAIAGLGVWALVVQSITLYAVRTSVLWIYSGWRPRRQFSASSVRSLFGLGSRLFATGMITQIFNSFSGIIIGKVYNAHSLGFYDRALKLKDAFASSVSLSVQNVTFPAFSSLQDDSEKLKAANRKVISVNSFVLFPVLLGLAAIADEGFMIVGQDKWMPAVPYFRIFCFSALCMPLTNISLNILKAMGKGGRILGIELVKKIFGLGAMIYAATISVYAVVWAYLAWSVFEMLVNVFAAKAITGYRIKELFLDTLPYLAMSAAMYFLVVGTGLLLDGYSVYLVFAAKLLAGAATYILMGALFKPYAWMESMETAKSLLNRKSRRRR